jgi:hypothetical protein
MQGSFLDDLLRDIGGFVLLDLHNLYCQVENFGIDPVALIDSYPLDLVQEIHLSGGSTSQAEGRRTIRRDTHDGEVPDAVFEMAELALRRCPNVKAVILERLGNTIDGEDEAVHFRAEFKRLLALRDEVLGGEISEAELPLPPGEALGATLGEPERDDELAAFQGRMLTTLYEQDKAIDIMSTLRAAPECREFLPYLDTFNPAMVEVAALLAKKWARRDDEE